MFCQSHHARYLPWPSVPDSPSMATPRNKKGKKESELPGTKLRHELPSRSSTCARRSPALELKSASRADLLLSPPPVGHVLKCPQTAKVCQLELVVRALRTATWRSSKQRLGLGLLRTGKALSETIRPNNPFPKRRPPELEGLPTESRGRTRIRRGTGALYKKI